MTARANPRPRGAPVVRAVEEATLEELARVGYGALSFDEVAARAGVNKTTVYRRWPTKPALVKAALTAFADAAPPLRESGDVREDLLAIARRWRDAMSTRHGRGLTRMLLGGCADPGVVELAMAIRHEFEARARRILARASERGALREDADPSLVVAVIGGWIVHMLFREQVVVEDARLERLVDLLLSGAGGQLDARSRSASAASGDAASTSRGRRRRAISAKSAIPSSPSTK
jgi:AcrR family transcriptional regulator